MEEKKTGSQNLLSYSFSHLKLTSTLRGGIFIYFLQIRKLGFRDAQGLFMIEYVSCGTWMRYSDPESCHLFTIP